MPQVERSPSDRAPSRPRSPRVHQAILEAAVQLFVEAGFHGMRMERVATRAGVGKAAIYRRWSTKEDLIMEAIAALFSAPHHPDSGNVRDDLLMSAMELHDLMTSEATGAVFPPMAAEVARGSRLGRAYAEQVIGPRRAIFAAALERGVQRGEIPAADLELAVDLLVGPLLLRRLTGRLAPPDPLLPAALVDHVLAALAHRDPLEMRNRP